MAAAAPGYGLLVAARATTALTHGTLFALALVLAVTLSPPASRGRAIAMVTAGWNLATLLGTWVGDRFGWRITFWCVAAVSALVLAAAVLVIGPGDRATVPRLRTELRALLGRGVAAVVLIIVFAQAGLFTVYTYVAPLLREVSGFTPVAVPVLLTVFGVGAVVGNLLGGRLFDRSPWTSLCAVLASFVALLAVLACTSRNPGLTAATVLILGATAAGLIPLVQNLAIAAALAAPTLATAVSASAFNLGAAAGSALGGHALHRGFSLDDLSWIGALVALPALILAGSIVIRHRRNASPPLWASIAMDARPVAPEQKEAS